MSATAEAWLTIPAKSAVLLGGVRWSHGCDALEDAAGQTIALSRELELVFDGLFAEGLAPHFVYVIGLLRAMKFGSSDPQFARLHQAYKRAKGATALSRNAGVLIRELCHNVAGKHRPSLAHVLQTLQSMQRAGERRRPEIAIDPPRPLAEFFGEIARQLAGYGDDDLDHWLRFGCDDLPENRQIEEALDSLPVRVLKLLAAARTRPRLAGAASLVPALDAALTLPPRKQSPDALPQGGYADVTTHGDLEHLLPSQFALDPDDFIRRFAERELLYFKREEPHAALKPDRVIVLDQGVRTWGRPRLALAGAALSMLKADARRVGDVRAYFTSTPASVDLVRRELDALVSHFEASDLTPHPADAFVRAIDEPGESDAPRDLVLLTHPNNLHIPLLEAKRRRRPADRVFAVTVADSGFARLDELLDEGLRPVRSFRLDLGAAEAVKVAGAPRAAPIYRPNGWSGDCEPIAFPFRPGLLGEPQSLTFSADGEWLAILGRDGMLHTLAADGEPAEVLPRAFKDGSVLKTVDAVLGVKEGVVVCGRMPQHAQFQTVTLKTPQPTMFQVVSSQSAYSVTTSGDVFVVAHYDFPSRRLRLHEFGSTNGDSRWVALPDEHRVVRLTDNDGPYHIGTVLDLESGTMTSTTGRPLDALIRARTEPPPPHVLPVFTKNAPTPRIGIPYLRLDGNAIQVEDVGPSWTRIEPTSEGVPHLAGKSIVEARLAGDVLALSLSDVITESRMLLLLRGLQGRILCVHTDAFTGGPFALSPDGSRLARCRGKRSVAIYRTTHAGDMLAVASPANLHNKIKIGLRFLPLGLQLGIGQFTHLFNFYHGKLSHTVSGDAVSSGSLPLGSPILAAYDSARFPHAEVEQANHWRAVPDRWGAVHLFSHFDRFVASFLIRRNRAAAWLPDGTFWGDASLIGGPPHPDAAARIGAAIHSVRRET